MEIPSTTPRQVTSHGKSVSPCMAQVARRDRADSALLAWIVVRAPTVPGVECLQEIGGLAAPDLADNNVIGAMAQAHGLHEVPDRHRFTVSMPRASKRTQFFRSIRSSSVSSMETMRSSAGSNSTRALSKRGLTRARAARHQDIPPSEQRGPCRVQDFLRQ